MKKEEKTGKRKLTAAVLLALLFIPVPAGVMKAGGTRDYCAVAYRIVHWKRLTEQPGTDKARLALLGLEPREYNEFITYWLPRMQENPYNLITFQTDAYTDSAVLHITPEPDSILRVFMAYQALKEPVEIEKPALEGFERVGFTVVEWGGTEITK